METARILSHLHLYAALVALLTGALVLMAPKGTVIHKRAGYVFAIALLLVNISAAFMYNLTGHFNFLHVFIMVSMVSLVYGLLPAVRRRPSNWLRRHISGMTGAALGVWAAGFAELTVRILPGVLTPSSIIGVATGMGIVFFFLIGFLIRRFVGLQEQNSKDNI